MAMVSPIYNMAVAAELTFTWIPSVPLYGKVLKGHCASARECYDYVGVVSIYIGPDQKVFVIGGEGQFDKDRIYLVLLSGNGAPAARFSGTSVSQNSEDGGTFVPIGTRRGEGIEVTAASVLALGKTMIHGVNEQEIIRKLNCVML